MLTTAILYAFISSAAVFTTMLLNATSFLVFAFRAGTYVDTGPTNQGEASTNDNSTTCNQPSHCTQF